jgi:hypothetical protein
MVAAVVLESKSRPGVIQVGPAHEPSRRVDEVRLDLGPRQAGLDQE